MGIATSSSEVPVRLIPAPAVPFTRLWLRYFRKYYREIRRQGLPLSLLGVYADSLESKRRLDRYYAAEMEAFRASVVKQGQFTGDFFSWNISHLIPLLAEFKDRGSRILEIGSYEGMSLVFFFQHLAPEVITCIDPYVNLAEAEQRFLGNMARFADAKRIQRLKLPSWSGLGRLLEDGQVESYDIVYVDGSHHAHDVMLDSILAWRLLRPGGIMLHDDYLWKQRDDPLQQPMIAVNAFLELVAGQYELLYLGYQIAFRKLASPRGLGV